MLRIPWRLYDPVLATEYFIPVNPNKDSGSFSIKPNLTYSVMAGISDPANDAESAAVIYAPGFEVEPFSYSGNVYTEQDLLDLETWLTKDYPIQIRDDLDRNMLVIIEGYDIERVRTRHHRWKHAYSFTGFVLEEVV